MASTQHLGYSKLLTKMNINPQIHETYGLLVAVDTLKPIFSHLPPALVK
uniref:Uncharacterized protein n=1 Tax=Rhizophora mucronata TaxID=61149 RepID=A0A2P2MF03_RHIMU